MSFRNLFRKKNKKHLFTTPSHSQNFYIVNKFQHLYKYDISETEAHKPEKFLNDAQERAKEIYGVNQTLFLTNGSTSGIITSILSCVKAGDNVLLWREAHPCHHNSIKLAGANPIYYEIPTLTDWGIPDKVQAETLEQYFRQYKITAVLITSPSYYGIVSDIKSISQLCKNHGVKLIVDEAHGALYPFSDKLPETSIKYADIVVQSLHKTAGGLNPTALIHSNLKYDLQPFLNMITTTSPSYPILSSIEANINYLNSQKGRNYLDNLINNINSLKADCPNMEFGGNDPTKILIKKRGLTGYELSEILFNKYKIEDEITNEISTMLLTGIGTDAKKIINLKKALKRI